MHISEVAPNYEVGKSVRWCAFSSTASNFNAAYVFAKAIGLREGKKDVTMFRMEIHSGKRISRFSCYPAEEEVLVKPNCLLQVLANDKIMRQQVAALIHHAT